MQKFREKCKNVAKNNAKIYLSKEREIIYMTSEQRIPQVLMSNYLLHLYSLHNIFAFREKKFVFSRNVRILHFAKIFSHFREIFAIFIIAKKKFAKSLRNTTENFYIFSRFVSFAENPYYN